MHTHWQPSKKRRTRKRAGKQQRLRKKVKLAMLEGANISEANPSSGLDTTNPWLRPVVLEEGAWEEAYEAIMEELGEFEPSGANHADIWIGNLYDQRKAWVAKWPRVDPNKLNVLTETRPRFSTLDSHVTIALKLISARIVTKDKVLRALLMKSALFHMRIVQRIDANDRLEIPVYGSCGDRGNPDDNAGTKAEVEELVLDVTEEDMVTLGLVAGGSGEHGGTLRVEPSSSNEESGAPAERGSISHDFPDFPNFYNPFAEKSSKVWICSESERFLAWARDPPRSSNDLVENFVHEDDNLATPTSHALIAIRAMKVRDFVKNSEVRRLLLVMIISHLKIISYLHYRLL